MYTGNGSTDAPDNMAEPHESAAIFAKVLRENIVTLDLELDAAPGSLARLWRTLNLHAVVPLDIEIRIAHPVIVIAIAMQAAGSGEQRRLLDALSRIMAVRRSRFRLPDALTDPGPLDDTSVELAAKSDGNIAVRRRFLGIFSR